jgi:hypothetical protein
VCLCKFMPAKRLELRANTKIWIFQHPCEVLHEAFRKAFYIKSYFVYLKVKTSSPDHVDSEELFGSAKF